MAICDSGALTPLPGSPFEAGRHPIFPTVDPGGRFLYVANKESDDVSGYAIDPTGGVLSATKEPAV